MTSESNQTRPEATRAWSPTQDLQSEQQSAGEATVLRDPDESPSDDAERNLISDCSDGTEPESSVGDFQLSFFLAQQVADEEGVRPETDRHGGRCPRFGRFVLLELLGRGGMGEVYRALHVRLRKQAAIKLLPMERAADPQARERFKREIRIISELKHPNIVRLENAGEIDGLPYLVMEYVPGMDLEQLVVHLGPLHVADACQLVGQAAIGLSHIHQQGLVHRDLKPGNLILSTDGALKIADLGLARLAEGDGEITSEGVLVGDPHFMAPEQIDGSMPVDIRSDIYSLGCTLFTLLTGRPPFVDAGPDPTKVLAAHLRQPFPAVTDPAIPGGLQKIVNRMAARQPSQRYSSPGEVAAALARFAKGCDLVALLRQADIMPRQAAPGAGSAVDSADYLTSTSGEMRFRTSRWRRLSWVGYVAAGVLLTLGAVTAYNYATLISHEPGEVAPEPEQAGLVVNTATTSPLPVGWRDQSKDVIDEHTPGVQRPLSTLAAIDPRRDAFDADVSTSAQGVTFTAIDGRGILQLPVQPPPEYTLEVVVERLEGEDSFGIGISAGEGRLLALIDHVVGDSADLPHCGLMHTVGGNRVLLNEHQARLLPVGERIRVQLDVSPDQVCLKVEDALALGSDSAGVAGWLTSCWDGDPMTPSLTPIDAYYPGVMFLHAYESAFHVHELRITGLDGESAGPLLFDSTGDSERRLAERILWRGGNVELLTPDGNRRADRLEDLPDDPWIVGIEDRDQSPSLQIDDACLQEIAGTVIGLKELDLRSSDVTNEGLAFISGISSLELLGLSGQELTGAGLSRLEDLPSLRTIFLNGMSIGDGDLQVLTRFQTLTYLCLSGCDITDAGVIDLAGAFPDLRHLCLNYTDVNGDCLPSLASFTELEELQLMQTRVTDSDLPAIMELPLLSRIVLQKTQVTKGGIATLREERPGLEVSR